MSQYTFFGFCFNHLKMQKLLSVQGFTEKGRKNCWQGLGGKEAAAKPNHLNSIPRAHRVEENWFLQTVIGLPNAYYNVCTEKHIYRHTRFLPLPLPVPFSPQCNSFKKRNNKSLQSNPVFCYVIPLNYLEKCCIQIKIATPPQMRWL